ncbi:hypothetical protein [Spiroplasma endosymbiont of Labia minor]|uniref:hypothetical protein n=1 Tax=Spiroplasma endosymbiont of Labia minor TaxID=3066305 RepID=UPI0030CA77EF
MVSNILKRTIEEYSKNCLLAIEDEIYLVRWNSNLKNNWIAKEITRVNSNKFDVYDWAHYLYNYLDNKRHEWNNKILETFSDEPEILEEYEESDIVYMRFMSLVSTSHEFLSMLVLLKTNENERNKKNLSLNNLLLTDTEIWEASKILQKTIIKTHADMTADFNSLNIPEEYAHFAINIQKKFLKDKDSTLAPQEFYKKVSDFMEVVQDTLEDAFDPEQESSSNSVDEQIGDFFQFLMTMDTFNFYSLLLYEIYFKTYFSNREDMMVPQTISEIRDEQLNEAHLISLGGVDKNYSHLKN